MEGRKLKNEVLTYNAVGNGTIHRYSLACVDTLSNTEATRSQKWGIGRMLVRKLWSVHRQLRAFRFTVFSFPMKSCRSYYVTGDPEQRCAVTSRERDSLLWIKEEMLNGWVALRLRYPPPCERERAGLQHTVRCLQEIKGLMGHLQLLVLPRTAVFRLTAERQRETLWLSRFTGPLGYYHALSAWWILSSDQLVSSDLLKPPVSCWIPSRQVWQTEAGQWERLQLWSWVSAGRACVWGQVLLFIFIMMMALTLWCTE